MGLCTLMVDRSPGRWVDGLTVQDLTCWAELSGVQYISNYSQYAYPAYRAYSIRLFVLAYCISNTRIRPLAYYVLVRILFLEMLYYCY